MKKKPSMKHLGIRCFMDGFISVCSLPLRDEQKPVDGSLDFPIPLEPALHGKQEIKAAVHAEAGKLPFDDAGKPYERAHVGKDDGAEGLLSAEHRKARRLKGSALRGERWLRPIAS